MSTQPLPLSPLPQKVPIAPLLQTSDQWRAQIEQLECVLKDQNAVLSGNRARTWLAKGQSFYLASAARFREVVARTVGLRIGAALIFGTLSGSIAVLLTRSPIITVLAFAVGTSLAALLCYWPNDTALARYRYNARNRLTELASQRTECDQSSSSTSSRLEELKQQYGQLQMEIRKAEEINSDQVRRERLVSMNWKAMRGPELEEFLAVVFAELGYAVEMTGKSGDQGVDLIATRDGFRLAIQSKGYVESVSNGAVQEAYAGMTYHRCDGCAVITNSRFTSAAAELALRIGCALVDENDLPTLIRGDLALLTVEPRTVQRFVTTA